MEESASNSILDGKITGIEFSLATRQEICISSNSDCPISHASQLSNPFLGLPLEAGKCESCGTAEPGKCEGHFGYIELPTLVYHPSHISELKRMFSLLCLKCLKLKNRKLKKVGLFDRALACCEEASQVTVDEDKLNKLDDTHAVFLVLKIPSKSAHDDSWDFLDRYGFRFCDVIPNRHKRRLLPSEVMAMLRKVPAETKKKLAAKGYFPQDGYIMQYLPVPPNCLSVPDVSDGISVMSSDLSLSVLRKVLKQVETIKGSRSGTPNFESSEIEANDLQVAIAQYLQVRGTAQASRDKDTRYGMRLEQKDSSTKAWLAKMKTLFIQKASGFSSRSVITGDPYRGVGEIGLPFEIAQRITFEERVNEYNLLYLQKLVDDKLCLSYRDGSATYSLREGSKGHTFLRPGQVVQRRIMDGDIVFINRPPTTHKHSLQALKVYVHEDHTVKINPLICGPLSADFDGDCVHLFYPQSLAAKAEVVELFSVEKQLLSSHDGNFNLKMAADSLLSLKLMFKKYFFSKPAAQQLAVFVSNILPEPALLKATNPAMIWTALQLLQTTLPSGFDYYSDNHLISKSQFLKVDFNRDVMPSIISDIVSSIFFGKGPDAVLSFFNSVQPMLMENLYSEGFSVGLEDFYIPKTTLKNIQTSIQDVSPLLSNLRSSYNELVELQLQNHVKLLKTPATDFILKKSSMGDIIDSKSESAINRVFQQIGFLGFQISDKGKLYSKTLVGEMSSLFHKKHPFSRNYRTEEFGFVSSCLFHGLDPYQEMVHSISSREVMVRSSRGLTEPGTLFKNLMAILRDVVVCYDGTVRNVCSHSVIQFEYGVQTGVLHEDLFAAGEPVGVLAATAMSTPAYKAVLDSSPTSNSSWEMMKEILQCKVNFRNEPFDRRVILYLADCQCGRKYCRENAAYAVKNHLKKLSLKDAAVEILIEYKTQQMSYENSEIEADLVGHIHLDKTLLGDSNLSMEEVLEKCEETLISFRKNKKEGGHYFKKIKLAFSECCCFNPSIESKWVNVPCLKFYSSAKGERLENLTHLLADTISPVLLKTIIKGDPRVQSANIIWISPDTTTWIRNPSKTEKGELAVDVVLEEKAVKKSGDSWRVVIDTCLPVMHLIDAKRSIPYGIKQVQQLLGISCAFEQSVQRLSMVTKGVLKDHLLLLGNSMTCSGNLIGFNSGGIKAVSKTLNAQIPFTEATLFTPKKCFEKAAEKCYVDSLSSIVASCSWGKPVAVGTGSNFDILLDTKEVNLHEQEGTDVYNFLSLVRSVSEEETNPACLGVDTEDLYVDEYMESALSPEHGSSLGKPVFDDTAEFDIDLSKDSGSTWGAPDSGWGKQTTPETGGWGKPASVPESGDAGWGKKSIVPESGDSGWGTKSAGPEPGDGGWGTKSDVPESGDAGWGKKTVVPESGDGGWGTKSAVPESGNEGIWGKKPSQASEGSFGKKAQEATDGDTWGNKPSQPSEGSWGKAPEAASDGDIWAKKPAQASGDSWGKAPISASDGDIWAKKPAQASNDSWGKAPIAASDGDIWGKKPAQASGDSWGKAPVAASDGDIWGKKPAQAGDDSWGKAPTATSDGDIWGKKPSQASEGSWGKIAVNADDGDIWNKKAPEASEGTWGKKLAEASEGNEWGKKVPEAADGWGKKLSLEAADDGGWGKKASAGQEPSSPSTTAWGSAEPEKKSDPSEGAWGKKSAGEGAGGGSWGQKSQEASGGSWGSGNKRGDDSEGGGGGWKRKEGWGGNEWKGKRDNNLPPGGRGRGRGGGRTNENYTPVPLTATRQRVDNFTADEQEVITKVDSVIQTLRRILHQSGYNDGDPVSAEHRSFVVDNVFNYHPDKDAKIGSGIDHITVKEHGNFQGSKCFFVASTDGKLEDFSYMKCLENFVKVKYPEKAESFLPKYFVKPQPRPNWNRERGNNSAAADSTSSPRPGSAQGSQEAAGSQEAVVGSQEAAVGTPNQS